MNARVPTSLLTSFKQAIYPAISNLVTKAIWVEGVLKGSAVAETDAQAQAPAPPEPFRILFIHNCLFNQFIQSRSFEPGQWRVVRQQRVLLSGLDKFITKHASSFDLCVAVLPDRMQLQPHGLSVYLGQEEVHQVIHTTDTWENIRLQFSKKRRQITNNFAVKSGLTYRISNELADFDLFYHRMHVPLIQRKYGNLSELDPYETLRGFFERGFVLLVEKDGQPVAGALSQVQDGAILFRRSGVLDGDESHVKSGAQTALYYFQIQHAMAQGYRCVDSLKSVPFLNDGVFCHKADWGAMTYVDQEAERAVHYVFAQPTAALARYFEINPTVIREGQTLLALVGDPSGECQTAQHIGKRYQAPGLQAYLTVSPTTLHHIELSAAPPVAAQASEGAPESKKSKLKG